MLTLFANKIWTWQNFFIKANNGNRTRLSSLGSLHTTNVLYSHRKHIFYASTINVKCQVKKNIEILSYKQKILYKKLVFNLRKAKLNWYWKMFLIWIKNLCRWICFIFWIYGANNILVLNLLMIYAFVRC